MLSGRRGLEFQSPPKCDDTAFDSLSDLALALSQDQPETLFPAVTPRETTPPFASAPGIGAKRKEWEDGGGVGRGEQRSRGMSREGESGLCKFAKWMKLVKYETR